MPVQKTKPTSAGRRFVVKVVHPDLHKGTPLQAAAGATEQDRRTQRQRTYHDAASRRRAQAALSRIDFKRAKDGIRAVVERLEYDPNRTANIALLKYSDGERRYIIAPRGLAVGDELMSGSTAPIRAGNAMALRNIPVGSVIHCVELKPGKGAQMVRSAGSSAQLVAREGAHATLRLRSGEMRRVLADCRATLGEVGNSEHNLRSLGKAGATRWRGVRPTVRGVAMNPVDHPHGGGEGRSSGGRHPVSPTGVPTKGYKTRKNKRTDKLIVRRRRKK